MNQKLIDEITNKFSYDFDAWNTKISTVIREALTEYAKRSAEAAPKTISIDEAMSATRHFGYSYTNAEILNIISAGKK